MSSTNHPNRGAGSASRNPSKEEIKSAREDAGLTATEAAELVHTTYRAWMQWETGDRRQHPAMWELFLLKIGAVKLEKVKRSHAHARSAS